jgi:hypothetical protein
MDVFARVLREERDYLRDAIAAAAHELGLFAALPLPEAELAHSLGVKPRRLRALVRALLREGVLAEEQGLLNGTAPRPPAPHRAGWGLLAEVIRSDRPLASEGVLGIGGEELRRFHDHLRVSGAEAAREVAGHLGPRGPLLDLGGGSGAYAAAFLEANPGERAVIVDRPEVLALAKEAVPLAERIPLDLLGDEPWPPGAGVALLANVLHLYSAEQAARLVQRAARSLVPGGRVAVKDFRAGSDAGIFFALNMALFTESGEVHEEGALQAFLREAGLREVRAIPLRSAADALLVLGVWGTAP